MKTLKLLTNIILVSAVLLFGCKKEVEPIVGNADNPIEIPFQTEFKEVIPLAQAESI